MEKVKRLWIPRYIKQDKFQELCDWVNKWGERDNFNPYAIKDTEAQWFNAGYEKAMKDIMKKLDVKFMKIKDKNSESAN